MPEVDIPGYGLLHWDHLVLDFNGTLAVDGRLISGVGERLSWLGRKMQLHVVTADTHGDARLQLDGLPCRVSVLPPGDQTDAKAAYVRHLGVDNTVAIGNGRNDQKMLDAAVLGIGVILNEGACWVTLTDADVVCTSILDALDLLRFPLRLVASLRF